MNIRRILALLILISIVALTGVIYWHLRQQAPKEILNMLPENVDLALADLHYTQNEEGQRRWTLDADKAEYQRGSSLAKLDVVRLLFYSTKEYGDINLQADKGQLMQETRQVDVWGNVILRTARGEKLYTERLHYDDSNHQLSTGDPIRFLSSQLELTGTGLHDTPMVFTGVAWCFILLRGGRYCGRDNSQAGSKSAYRDNIAKVGSFTTTTAICFYWSRCCQTGGDDPLCRKADCLFSKGSRSG